MASRAKIASGAALIVAVGVLLLLPRIALLSVIGALAVFAQIELLALKQVGNRLWVIGPGTFIFLSAAICGSNGVLITLLSAMALSASALLLGRGGHALDYILIAAFSWAYVAIPLGLTANLWLGPHGVERTIFLIFSTSVRNIGAGLLGPLLPGHSISWASPRKTYEGGAIGLLVTLGLAFLLRGILFPTISVSAVATLSVLVSLLGQLGDLMESMIKRECQARDSANLLPGQGGILDTVDSFLFTGPAVYFYFVLLDA